MQCIVKLLMVAVFGFSAIIATPLQAVNVSIDYSYDTSNFFGAGNPNGSVAGTQARDALEAAASYFSGILTDTLSEIETPADFHSGTFSGVVSWQWDLSFTNPYSGGVTTLYDETIAEDEYRIYVGARSFGGDTLGVGGPGGWGWSSNPSGGFTAGEIDQINAITDAFSSAISTRGEPTGFANWGGALSFDSDASTTWHYDHTTSTPSGTSDFFSVAIHEIAHALGLGTSDEWVALVAGSFFTGSAAYSEHGGSVPLHCPGTVCTGHWADGTTSEIHGTMNSQEAAMDPTLTSGTRKRFTNLDAAALTDIGWSVSTPIFDPADFDLDGDVDDDDYYTFETSFGVNDNGDTDGDGDTDGIDFLTWQRNFNATGASSFAATVVVPEPSSAWLLLLGVGLLIRQRLQ